MKNNIAGFLALGALSLVFAACSPAPDKMTQADRCLENGAAALHGIGLTADQIGGLQKHREKCIRQYGQLNVYASKNPY